MSRFAQAASFAMPPAGDLNTQSPLLRNAAPMDPYAAAIPPGAPVGAPGATYGPDPYGGFAPGGLPPGPGAAGGAGMDPYGGGLSGGGLPPPGAAPPGLPSDPYASSAGLGGPVPLPGAPPDPYAMTSFAGTSPPGFSPSISSAISDPYAPGGSFAPRGSPRSGLQVPHFRGMPPHGSVPSPKSLPKWLRWLAVGALVFIVGAVVLHMMRRGAPTPPPPLAAPPHPSCPPMPAACPPVAPAVPAKPEEITLRLAKDDVPIKVQVQGLRPEDNGDERKSCADDDSRAPREQGPRDGTGRPVPPVVIVNEAQPSATPAPDLWELSYAGNSGAALPRMGDTNMVYTRVGGPL